MNEAVIGKIGWTVLTEKERLWCRVIRSKYKIGETHGMNWLTPKSYWSSTCKAILMGIKKVILPSVTWVIRDGMKANFWLDKWVGEVRLVDCCTNQIPPSMLNGSVSAYWIEESGWRVEFLSDYLPLDMVRKLNAIPLTQTGNSTDRWKWPNSRDGNYTVRSAYKLITATTSQGTDSSTLYKRIWRVAAPERVRVFLWLVVNQAVLTNEERHRRHFAESGTCTICELGTENLIHTLRDCPAIESVWKALIPHDKYISFFSESLLNWIYTNLSGKQDGRGETWPSMFATTIWWSWKWRCSGVFGNPMKCRDKVMFVREKSREYARTNATSDPPNQFLNYTTRMISWEKPDTGWVALNTDGASKGNPGLACAGGVLRNSQGDWLGGFAMNIGTCTVSMAELWGAYHGLKMAWEMGFRRVRVQLDSKIVILLLKKGLLNGTL